MVRPIALIPLLAISLGILASESIPVSATVDANQSSPRPGDTILIDVRNEQVDSDTPIRAVFDQGQLAPARLVGRNLIEVVVPMLEAGETMLALYQGSNLLGR